MESKTELSATQPENDEPRVYFSKKSTKVDIEPWYRGDRRDPVRIFDEGFSSRGTNPNLLEHVHGNHSGPIKNSGYISTSTSQEAALRYPKEHMGRSYLYLINPQKDGIDVNKALVLEIDSGRLARDTAEFYLADKEIAVPYKIESKHIKGAWVAESTALTKEYHELCDLYKREVKPGSFIGNPAYIEPYAKTIKTLKITGKGVMTIGIYLDTNSLFEMYQHAEASGNYHPFFTEAARVAGGWSGAVALGECWGTKGSGYAYRFTKHPGAVLTCGVVGALVGAVIGYNGGGLIATETYDHTFNPNEPSIWTDLYHTLQRMEPALSNSSIIKTHGIQKKDDLGNLFEKLNAFWDGFKQEIREEGSISAAVKRHLPKSSQEKLSVIEVLKRMDYNYLPESSSARFITEELFGKRPENPLRRRHSSAELLSHAKPVEEPLSHLFRDARVEPLSDEELRQHTIGLFKHASVRRSKKPNRTLNSNQTTTYTAHEEQQRSERALVQEEYYKKRYALTERAQKLQKHFRTGELLESNVSFSEGCKAISSAANDLAIIANAWHLPGGRELSIIGKGTERIAAGSLLLCMENAPAFATPLGWLSVVAGIAVLTTLGDEDDENDALQELKRALVQLGMMLNQVLQNQQKIIDTLDVILKSVLDVEARVKQHQTETRNTLSFISTYQLQDACLAIQGDLAKTNAVSLTSDARREALSILERWLHQHLFHAGLSREASGPTSSKLAVETLSAYPAMNTMGLILVQLQAHLGTKQVPNEFVHLPPLNLFIHVAQLFLTGVLSAELPSDDGCEALCKKLVDVVQTYEKLINYLRTESVIWDALFKQYEHQRNMVGRALSAANLPNQAVPIDSLVTHDLKRRNLMDALDQMEERRLLLVRLVEFAFDGGIQTLLHQKVMMLETKQHILSTHASSLHALRTTQYYYPEAHTKDASNMQLALRAGVNLNLAHLNGNVLNYIGCRMVNGWGDRPQAKRWEVDLVHLVMKHSSPDERLDASMQSTYAPARTWPAENYAMTMCSNSSRYGFALLLMIAGFSKHWNRDSLLNSDWWTETSHLAREYQMFLSATIRPDGVLNRHKLVRAFQYYQACESGEISKAEAMIREGVDVSCVLWLVSLLGKWIIFDQLKQLVNLSQSLGTYHFVASPYYRGYVTIELGHGYPVRFSQEARYTPLMVAAEHGRVDVIEGLIAQHEAGKDIGIAHTLAWGDSAASLAFQQEHFEIAQRLHDLGSPLSAQQIAALNAKALPHAALSIEPNPIFEVLEQSRLETHDSSQSDALSQMVSSIQDFSAVFKTKLNAKIRLFDQLFKKQDTLLQHCIAFDTLGNRVQKLVEKGMLSSETLGPLHQSQIMLHGLYHQLQREIQRLAEAYAIPYEKKDEKLVFDAIIDTPLQEGVDDARLHQTVADEFKARVHGLAQDLGIELQDTLSLIHDLANYLEHAPANTKDFALILFGSTGVGKTTLFNFLTGCLYQEAENEEDGNVFREKVSGIELSEVGHGALAKTIFPVVAELEDKPYALIDMPGSADNRGKKNATTMSPYDISAAIGMKCIVKRFDNIKGILVVCPDEQLTPERPPVELQEVFQQVGRMIQDKPHLAANIMLAVTKQGRRTLKQVLGRLRNIAKAFTDDIAMSTFLNAFIQDEHACDRMMFMDVISELDRATYFARLDALQPQPTRAYNFEEYSHRLDKLRQLLRKLSESRFELEQKISALHVELASLNSLEENHRRSAMITRLMPQFTIVGYNDSSIEEIGKTQHTLLEECEKTKQLDGLLHQIQIIEETLKHQSELSQTLQQLHCQEKIESDFYQRLGLLCAYHDEYSPPNVHVRGTMFHPNRTGMMSAILHSSQQTEDSHVFNA